MALRLTVTTRSETAPGSGESDGSVIDRDIVHDRYGLPYLPARRIKGLLRESAFDVVSMLGWAGVMSERDGLLSLNSVFGASGSHEAGWVRFDDLTLEGAEDLHTWLRWSQHQAAARDERDFEVTPLRVLEQYTAVRAQTRIDAETGTAEENTLRRTRVLRRGLTFAGRVEIIVPDDEYRAAKETASEVVLALACAGLRRVGLSRNRGLGRVDAGLWSDDEDRRDRIRPALADLARMAQVEAR